MERRRTEPVDPELLKLYARDAKGYKDEATRVRGEASGSANTDPVVIEIAAPRTETIDPRMGIQGNRGRVRAMGQPGR